MEKIKRNVSKPKAVQFAPAMKSEKINEVVNEVNNLKDKQVDLDGKLETMRLENEALWKEVMLINEEESCDTYSQMTTMEHCPLFSDRSPFCATSMPASRRL